MGYCSCYVQGVNCDLPCPLPRTRQDSDKQHYVNCPTFTPRHAAANYHESVTGSRGGDAPLAPVVHQ